MARTSIPPPLSMEMKGDIATNWETFKDSWENYAIATELTKKPPNVIVATLLTVMGNECFKVYKNLPLTEEEKKSAETILEKLTEEFQSKRNIIYERYLFNSITQEANETFDRFLNRLRERSTTCKFAALESEMLRDRIVIGVTSDDTRERLLREKDLDLDKAINICRTSEMATKQLQSMHTTTETVQFARTKPSKPKTTSKPDRARNNTCKYCGDTHPRGNCKAYGQTCAYCNKRNHLAKVCLSKQQDTSTGQSERGTRKFKQRVHQLESDTPESSENESEGSLYNLDNKEKKRKYFAQVLVSTQDQVTQHPIKFQLDTGATCCTLSYDDYQKITSRNPDKSNITLKLYDKSTIKPMGEATLYCTANSTTRKVHFQIIKDAPVSLLSGRVCEALSLLEFNDECVYQMTTTPPQPTKEKVLQEYKDVFTGLGTLPGTYHIEMDPDVKPVQNNPRRVPIPVQEELKQKLNELEEMGVLTKVKQPTPWISNMVAVKQPNKLRVCLDPLELNKAIVRNHYPTPTIDDVAPKLTNAKVFSVLDAKDGFLQVVLDEPSSFLTTFWTPYGRYRWLRMPFGIKSAPEEFQRRIDECLEGLENISAVYDDILIYGTGDSKEEASKSHDAALRALLDRCRERDLKLNPKKFKYKLEEIPYLGHVVSAKGISADPDKVQAVQDMPQPTDTAGVQRLLGVVTYLAKFLPRLSTVAEPLRRLTDKDAAFDWLPQHDKALAQIKEMITAAPVLHFYNKDKEVTIECDSSDVGLGAVISQEGHPIAYASRALTQTERNYAQIEKECLAIVFAAERFEHYILAKDNVKVLTDHKPLVTIFKKSILTSPKRLQRMRLRLQKFSLTLEYKPGPKMYISDTLSRAALPINRVKPNMDNYQIFQAEEEDKLRKEIEDIDMEDSLFVTDQRLKKIRLATSTDFSLQTLMTCIKEGWPETKCDVPLCIKEYWPYRDELSTQNGLAFRGTRIIIPSSMRKEMIERAHASHLGIEYTTGTAREIMYWPKMNAELTEAVKNCKVCQESQPAQTKEPMMSHPIPQLPWQAVASDCFEIQGEHFVVLVDLYSDYIEVSSLSDMSTKAVIEKMKPMFATHGVPAVLITDNGSNYSSQEFKEFTQSWDIYHVTTSPHHHKSNGKVESAVKIMKGLITKCKKEDKDMWKAILEWRNSPTPGTTSSPAQRLMSRRTRSMLPGSEKLYKPEVQTNVTEQIIKRRKVAKYYHDRNCKPLPKLIIGQPVNVKTHPQQPNTSWKPGTVISEAHTPRSYIVKVGEKSYRRNRTHLRDAPSPAKVTPVTEEEPKISSVPQNTEIETPCSSPQPSTAPPTTTTRSGRCVKPPQRLQDYV